MIASPHLDALRWAQAQVGKAEEPLGSNSGPFVRSCQAATWLPGSHWPWCVAFFVRAWEATGSPLPYRGAGAWAFLHWAERVGWAVPLEAARPGDAIVWRFGSGHLSMLEAPASATLPRVRTVDGNVNDRVERRSRHRSQVLGAVRIHHSSPAHPRPPLFEVATSASGHKKVLLTGGRSKVAAQLARLFNRYGGLTVRRRRR